MRRGFVVRWATWLLVPSLLGLLPADGARAESILFVGNSFTFADRSPVMVYRAQTVTDLNGQGAGGVPALFKSFTVQAGMTYDVYLETHPGVGLDWHLEHERAVIGARPWDAVVLQSLSTVDAKKPGDPAVLVDSVRSLAAVVRAKNAGVEVRLMATWPRADLTYLPGGAWYGKPIEAMARDIRTAYDLAAAGTPGVRGVIPVGDAWIRAMHTGLADANPYDGIEPGKVNLWAYDNHHASAYGYYLEALMVFGSVTGRDPRSLRTSECSGYELGLSPTQVGALEQVAFDQLTADGLIGGTGRQRSPPPRSTADRSGGEPDRSAGPARCAPMR